MRARRVWIFALIGFLAVACPARAEEPVGMPATTLEIVDTSRISTPGGKKWFLAADYSTDVASKGAKGFGLSVGRVWNDIYADLSATFYSATYGAIRIEQTGVNRYDSPLEPDAEIARKSDSDPGSIYTVGPGVGFIYRLLDSEKFVEMGRAGIGFAQYSDQKKELIYRGGLVSFHGAIGYRMGSAILAPGITWNLGYVQRVKSPGGRPLDTERHNYLPMQWWAFQLNLHLWMF
ncbi:MAG: hypothetical protein HYW49_08855 [Deltaproteobacteria bacterium]|nr:hypothetical protein [Deltaproteobacteria bacterium]